MWPSEVESSLVESAVIIGGFKRSIISDGEGDVILGFELVETYRGLRRCSSGSTVISNAFPIVPCSAATGQMEHPDIRSFFYQ